MLSKIIQKLESHGHLLRIKNEVSPYLEMSAIHLRVFEQNGPAILFENIKGCKFKALSNLFGNKERCELLFGKKLDLIEKLSQLALEPSMLMKKPIQFGKIGLQALTALPRKTKKSRLKYECQISDLPQIHCWKKDGGAFITLPMVYTESPKKRGVFHSNVGMYRIQLSGNEYQTNQQIGLHYQIHRGIGVHQQGYIKKSEPMKVSVMVGGHPGHILSSIFPLPEGMSEVLFAGILSGKRFRYHYDENGNFVSNDSDFVITGYVDGMKTLPEGPFGDHLGYYSLKHQFPVMQVSKVYHKKEALWPFTVVGRPPQEDTFFGRLIHEMTFSALRKKIPGLKELNAVDEAGVHPLLLAIASERYTPYLYKKQPQEVLTTANQILGTGQLSLAKYLFICDYDDNKSLQTQNLKAYFIHILERIDLMRDIHFQTQTTIDTLDYSSEKINAGSKVVFAAVGKPIRKLGTRFPDLQFPSGFKNPKVVFDGVVALQTEVFTDYDRAKNQIDALKECLAEKKIAEFPLVILCDNSGFVSENIRNFVWETFTKSNPSHDIYGVNERFHFKHWQCEHHLIIDARKKPHHAPELIMDESIITEKNKKYLL